MLTPYFDFLILDKWIERNRTLCGSVAVHALMKKPPSFWRVVLIIFTF
jgi:hypothetical protein